MFNLKLRPCFSFKLNVSDVNTCTSCFQHRRCASSALSHFKSIKLGEPVDSDVLRKRLVQSFWENMQGCEVFLLMPSLLRRMSRLVSPFKACIPSTFDIYRVAGVRFPACVHACMDFTQLRRVKWFLEGRQRGHFISNNSQVTPCPSWSSLIWSLRLSKPSFTGANH